MDNIVVATPEQIEKIAATSDLTPTSKVWAMGENLAVLRLAPEIDPLLMAEGSSNKRKALFMWGLENILKGSGMTEYYFNILDSETEWMEIVKSFGAEMISVAPERRFKKLL